MVQIVKKHFALMLKLIPVKVFVLNFSNTPVC